MQELAPERRAIDAAFDALNIDAWVFEKSAGARPQSIQQTYLDELAAADLYLGVFWKGYGDYTIDEFEHARSLKKDCLIYEKRVDLEQRDPQLEAFLKKIGNVESGLTTSWFQTAEEFAQKAKTDVLRWQTTMARRALNQGIDAERERLEAIRAQEQAAPRQRVVNLAPQGIAELFKDRTTVMADVLDALLARDNGLRAFTIYGQGGIGKTALACRVMRELEHNDAVHGIVYLSARTTGISFERIYRDSARMLGGDVEEKLMNGWKKEDSKPDVKTQALLEAYGNERSVLLLDNLESVLDENGVLMEDDLQQFLNAFLGQNHGARLLITSREPLNPANENRKYQKLIPLDQGLPLESAIELLRDLDPNGELGLRDAPEALLKQAAEKTQGFPTALEAIFSILSEEKQLSLEALLGDATLFGESVIKNLVQAALSRLDPGGHLVMQALAVFGRPVREVGIHYLLEGHAESAGIHETLRRLTRGLYVNIKRATGELILHPFYREFSYSQIPVDANAPCNRATLESRAAAYYAQLRAPREKWQSIGDLDPQLFEFEHWVRAGEYDRAAEVLSTIDLDFLIWQGSARRVRDMRAVLDGRIQNRRLQLQHHDALGQVCMVLGPHEDGLQHFKQMEAIASELGDLTALGHARRNLGETSRLLGRHDEAIAYCRDAVRLFRQQETAVTELEQCLFFLGLAYCYGGYAQEAIECGEEVRTIAASRRDVSATARAHNALALANLLLERWDPAVEHCRQARDAYTAVNGLDGICFVGNVEGMALFGGGRCDEALRVFDQYLTRARECDMPRAQGLILFNQARAFRALKQPQAALESARAALAVLTAGQFQAVEAARALIEALLAAALGDRAGEARQLLDCARASLANPDLQPPADLAREVETAAADLGMGPLASDAAQLTATMQSRSTKRSPSATGLTT
jgi:tetratricopeptide (TPR) repeat protein